MTSTYIEHFTIKSQLCYISALVVWKSGHKQILLSFSDPWRVYSSELPCSSRGFFKHIIKHIINLYHRKYPFRPLGGEKQL